MIWFQKLNSQRSRSEGGGGCLVYGGGGSGRKQTRMRGESDPPHWVIAADDMTRRKVAPLYDATTFPPIRSNTDILAGESVIHISSYTVKEANTLFFRFVVFRGECQMFPWREADLNILTRIDSFGGPVK